MVKGDLCGEVVEVMRESDGSCVSFCGGRTEAGLWVCSEKWKKFGRKTISMMS